MTIIDLIPLLETMPHDELRDWIDYVDFWHISKLIDKDDRPRYLKAVRNRRTGLDGSLPYDEMFSQDNPLTMTTPAQKLAITHLEHLTADEMHTVSAMAKAFKRLKAPIRKSSQGNIQVKWIPYEYIERDPETGKPKYIDENGKPIKTKTKAPYLYLRYWQVQGDADRKKSRVKSIYIGGEASFAERRHSDYEYPYRTLAYHFHDLIQQHGIKRTRNKGKPNEKTYKVRPAGDDNPITELENKILACVDMSEVDRLASGAIDPDKLKQVQASLTDEA